MTGQRAARSAPNDTTPYTAVRQPDVEEQHHRPVGRRTNQPGARHRCPPFHRSLPQDQAGDLPRDTPIAPRTPTHASAVTRRFAARHQCPASGRGPAGEAPQTAASRHDEFSKDESPTSSPGRRRRTVNSQDRSAHFLTPGRRRVAHRPGGPPRPRQPPQHPPCSLISDGSTLPRRRCRHVLTARAITAAQVCRPLARQTVRRSADHWGRTRAEADRRTARRSEISSWSKRPSTSSASSASSASR